MIQHRDMLMWQDKNGRWQCRRIAADVVYRSARIGPTSSTEAIRARLWGRRASGNRYQMGRRDADDITPVIGNCGRPADQECSMLDPQQCAIHRQEPALDGGEETKRLHRLIVRAHRARLHAPTAPPANESRAERLSYVRRLRERHALTKPDPCIVTADCQFRMRRW
jgi:hypothetical protein